MKGGADELKRAERTEMSDIKEKEEQSFQSFLLYPGECDVKQLLVSVEEMQREHTRQHLHRHTHQMCADVTLSCDCLMMMLKMMVAIVELRRMRRS